MTLREIYRVLKDRWDVRRHSRIAPRLAPDGFLYSSQRRLKLDNWETKERNYISKLLPKMDLFINFGAYHGYYSCLALKFSVQTIAFEPAPENCAVIAKNVQTNGWEGNFTLFPVAVSNRNGLAEFFGLTRTNLSLIYGWSNHSHLKSRMVPVHKIDDLIPEHIVKDKNTFILMDIEGAEGYALEHASTLLFAHPKPVWMIEVIPELEDKVGSPALRAFEIMKNAGYSCYVLNDNAELERLELPSDSIFLNRVANINHSLAATVSLSQMIRKGIWR